MTYRPPLLDSGWWDPVRLISGSTMRICQPDHSSQDLWVKSGTTPSLHNATTWTPRCPTWTQAQWWQWHGKGRVLSRLAGLVKAKNQNLNRLMSGWCLERPTLQPASLEQSEETTVYRYWQAFAHVKAISLSSFCPRLAVTSAMEVMQLRVLSMRLASGLGEAKLWCTHRTRPVVFYFGYPSGMRTSATGPQLRRIGSLGTTRKGTYIKMAMWRRECISFLQVEHFSPCIWSPWTTLAVLWVTSC